MRNWAMWWLCLCLAACAGVPMAPPEPLFLDRQFGPPPLRISKDDVFALSDEMRRYLKTEMAAPLRQKGPQRALVDALYRPGGLKLEYDSALTRNAAEAFAARAGNCLSLVIMTAAIAKELDLMVEYGSAYADETWSRSGGLYFRSGHVNVTLGRRMMHRGTSLDPTELTIDFLPADEIRGLRTQTITEHTVVAMYMNNRAAEALAVGRLEHAYWWAREAIAQSPAFLSAYNTLGVVYLRHGDVAQADRVFARILEREPDNTQALSNRAQALAQLGRGDEASALRRRLAQLEPDPPFHFFDLGRRAMGEGDFTAARDLFAREVRRAEYNPEFQFWLGVAHFKLGDTEAARRHLNLALRNSSTRSDRDLYAAKLAWLQAHRQP